MMPVRHASDAIHVGQRSYPLAGFGRRVRDGAEIVAMTSMLDAFERVLAAHETLYDWARHQEQPRALRGRAPVYVATLDDPAAVTVVVRHSWHGGLLAPFTGDRFLRPTRAPMELLRACMLRACAIPTPDVLAFALYAAGPMMVRVDVATRYIDGAYDFASVLADLAPGLSREGAYAAVRELCVALARFGFHHPDLNVKNILLYQQHQSLVAAVLDVDVVEWQRERKPGDVMLQNAARLARSMRKARTQFGVALTDDELNDFVAGLIAAAPHESAAPSLDPATFTDGYGA